MYSLKSDAAMKKKRQARRLSQSGRKTTSSMKTTSTARSGRGRVHGGVVKRQDNPFFAAPPQASLLPTSSSVTTSATPATSTPADVNLFLTSTSSTGPPPPSYASVASGKTPPSIASHPVPVGGGGGANINPFLAGKKALAAKSVKVGVSSRIPLTSGNHFPSHSPPLYESATMATARGEVGVSSQVPLTSGDHFPSPPLYENATMATAEVGVSSQVPLTSGDNFPSQSPPLYESATMRTTHFPSKKPSLGDHKVSYDPRTHTVPLGRASTSITTATAIATATTLHLKAIPPQFNNKLFLQNHFSQFGKVIDLKCNKTKMFATVHFQTHEGAAKAKRMGQVLDPNVPPVKIFWHANRGGGGGGGGGDNDDGDGHSAGMTAMEGSNIKPHPASSSRYLYVPGKTSLHGYQSLQDAVNEGEQREAERQSEQQHQHHEQQIQGTQQQQYEQQTQQQQYEQQQQRPQQHHEQQQQRPQQHHEQQQQRPQQHHEQQQKRPQQHHEQQQQRPQQHHEQQQQRPQQHHEQQQKHHEQQIRRTQEQLRRAQQQHESEPPKIKAADSKGKAVSIFDRLGDKVKEKGTKKKVISSSTAKRKLQTYDEEDWLPPTTATITTEQDDEDEGVGGDEEGSGPVRKSVLKDLGNKFTGDEMDTIARTVSHQYYLRSLDQPLQYPSKYPGQGSKKLEPAVNTSTAVVTQATACPYAIPKLRLKTLPTPKGNTAGDYYDALDSRDADIRKGMKKQTSLMEAQVIIGTCPDMCPEKERYRREDTRRLSWFELSSDSEHRNLKVDHTRAVKEYSGSAADKEEPLPHELRPIGVLQMTMDYLVTMVMDAGSDRPDDWYDFLWNRTRGIRKDITIQHLCSPESIQLIERCARFHILCAHHLVEEDPATFDPKLNNENFNKCLLSLKESYRDIRVVQGITCSNEAEFCCYDILFHLSDGDVLNLIQEYSPGIRYCPQVRFAIEAALSFEANNFIKLMKLIKSTTFLNACLLHRYFLLIQSRGLKVLNRAHSMQKHSTPFPLRDLAKMLGLVDETHAASYCESFDLNVTGSNVYFDRLKTDSINLEGKSVVLEKSHHLVLNKNRLSLGEVVYGGPLPPRYDHTPYSSFTSNPSEDVVDGPTPSLPPPSYSSQDLLEVVADIVKEETNLLALDLTRECLAEAEEEEEEERERNRILDNISLQCCEEIIQQEVTGLSTQVTMETYEEMLHRTKVVEGVTMEICHSVVDWMVAEVCRSCVLDKEVSDLVSREVCLEVLQGVGKEEVLAVAREATSESKKLRKERMEVLRKQYHHWQLMQSWRRWRCELKLKRHVHECAAGVPPLPLHVPLTRLLPSERWGELMGGGCEGVTYLLDRTKAELEKKREKFFSKFNLPSLLSESLTLSREPMHFELRPPDLYWKLIFMYPLEMTDIDKGGLSWICSKLGLSEPRPTTPNLEGNPASITSSDLGKRRLMLAVRGMCAGVRGEGMRALALQGTCSLAMFIPAPSPDFDMPHQELFLIHHLNPVLEVFGARKSEGTKLPLLIIYSTELEDKHLALWYRAVRGLEAYIQDKPISQILYMKLDTPIVSTNLYPECIPAQLSESLCQLALHSPCQPSLFHVPIRDYLEQGLRKHFVDLVVGDSQKRYQAGLPSQPPQPLVALYNGVLKHLSHRATDRALTLIQWPMPEFLVQNNNKFSSSSGLQLPPLYWNSPAYLQEIRCFLNQLLMPSDCGGFPNVIEDGGDAEEVWSRHCAHCMRVVSALVVTRDDAQHSSMLILSRIESLLHQHWLKFKFDQSHSIPWDQVIITCVEHTIALIDSDLSSSGFLEAEEKVVLPIEWLHAQANTALNSAVPMATRTPPPHRIGHKRHLSDPPSLCSLESPPTMTSLSLGSDDTLELEKKIQRLESSIQTEKSLSENFEAELEGWLSSPPLPISAHLSSSPLPISAHHTSPPPKNTSIREKLSKLAIKIREAKLQDTLDLVSLHSLANQQFTDYTS